MDDDPGIHEAYRLIFEDRYKLISAPDGPAALVRAVEVIGMDVLPAGNTYGTCENLPAGAKETIAERYLKSPAVDVRNPEVTRASETAYRVARQLGYDTSQLVFGMFEAGGLYIVSFYPKPVDPPGTGRSLTVVLSRQGAVVCVLRGA